MENSIGLLLRGGLGNQLFQIFTVISKAIDTNRDFYIVQDLYDKRPLYKKLYLEIINKITNNHNYYLSSIDSKKIYYEIDSRKFLPLPDDTLLLTGYFANPYYFNHNRNKIIEILKLNELQLKHKFDFEKIVAIHFRFEDCITAVYIQKPDFYIDALNKIKEETKEDFYNYNFIIFSSKGEKDNSLTDFFIREINKGFETPINFIKFQDLYPNAETEDEFLYMSNCNYFINGLSTFSWFAYYISPNNNKKMIISNQWKLINDIHEIYHIDGIIMINTNLYNKEELSEILNNV